MSNEQIIYPDRIIASGDDHVFVLSFEDEVLDDDVDSTTYETYVAVYHVRQVLK